MQFTNEIISKNGYEIIISNSGQIFDTPVKKSLSILPLAILFFLFSSLWSVSSSGSRLRKLNNQAEKIFS
jgi:hypothetical protein